MPMKQVCPRFLAAVCFLRATNHSKLTKEMSRFSEHEVRVYEAWEMDYNPQLPSLQPQHGQNPAIKPRLDTNKASTLILCGLVLRMVSTPHMYSNP